jgi:hypothetical protein
MPLTAVGSLTASGTVSGTRDCELPSHTDDPCPGLFNGSIAVEQAGTRLRGAYAGDGCGMGVAASFIVDRR